MLALLQLRRVPRLDQRRFQYPITLFLMNAPAQMLALFMTMLWMIEQLWPITHLDPIKEPDSISA